MKLDFNSTEIRCNLKYIDIGVAAKKALSKAKVSELDIMGFRKECTLFLPSAATKLVERSPLKLDLLGLYPLLYRVLSPITSYWLLDA